METTIKFIIMSCIRMSIIQILSLILLSILREKEELEVIRAAEEAALAEAEAATYEAAAVAVAHGIITQEEVDALKRYFTKVWFSLNIGRIKHIVDDSQ